ncbi:S24 family peptidase [Rhizobium favelukesii]|uniref:S24 family peptidase n=1 Tax=Rhizobium favelukesii TaxID=348824 RepID=UPI00215FAE80|nr:S24 family peptidase [Rhizobium favelukesii]MCS0459503.1 S24 family peptidase [Rhizobium favelukesii]
MDRIRKLIADRIDERHLDYKEVSEALGYNHAYIQQFLKRGVPNQLKEKDLRKLAEILDLEEELLGLHKTSVADAAASEMMIDEIDVTAGLGGGGLSVIENTTQNGITFHREVVRDVWRLPDWMLGRFNARPQHIKAFPSQGDSMTPTINDGDVVFVDTRHRVPSPPGVYALADEFGGVVVKRLEVISRPGDEIITVQISSDNPRHTTRELNLDEIQIIGRYIGRFTI